MKFMIGEGWMSQFERATYRGGVGFYYNDTLGGIITYAILAVIAILAIIGLLSVLKWIFLGRRPKEDPGKKWLRTGKF